MAIATLIVLAFALFGQPLLNQLGVSLPALQVAGGIILLIIALDMTLSKRPSPARLTLKESEEAESKAEAPRRDHRVPAGHSSPCRTRRHDERHRARRRHQGGSEAARARWSLAILAVMLVTLVFLLLAQEVHALIGLTARKVIVRVFGVLLAAIAVQSIFNGITASHIFS